MKILHITPYYWPAVRYGGPIFSVSGLCRELSVQDVEVYVYTTNIDGENDLDIDTTQVVDIDGVHVRYFSSKVFRRYFYSPEMLSTLKKEIDTFDLVHIHTVFLWPTVAAARIARLHDIPYIIAPRGMLEKDLFLRKSSFLKRAWMVLHGNRILREAHAVHATTQREICEIERFGLPPLRYLLIPNGINIPLVNQDKPVDSFKLPLKPYVLYLGRINWKKGIDRLVKAWASGISIDLVIAGNDDGYLAELMRLVHKYALEEKIHIVGPVQGEDKWQLYRNAEMMVLPSYSENFGNVVIEAMSARCPVIVTPEVGASEILIENNCGIVVDGEPGKLAAAILALLDDAAHREQLKARGLSTVRDKLSWPKIAAIMKAAYIEIIEKQRGKTSEAAPLEGLIRG